MRSSEVGRDSWSGWDGASGTVTSVRYERNGFRSGTVLVTRSNHTHAHHGPIKDMRRLAESLAAEHRLEPAGPDCWEANHPAGPDRRPAPPPGPPVATAAQPGRPVTGWPPLPPR